MLGARSRLRPLLAYATGEWLGIAPERLDGIAVAIEFVHAYSLVHDDLPALDDRELGRGRPATHVAFDEATAILAGDALQAHAYGVLATDAAMAAPAGVRRQLILDMARASGSRGMAGGQALGRDPAASDVEAIYMKSASLVRAAVVMPCRLRPELGPSALAVAERYGEALGLALQVADDATASRDRLDALRAEASAALHGLGAEADGLRWICERATTRDR